MSHEIMAEISRLQDRVDHLERELERKNEIISDLVDRLYAKEAPVIPPTLPGAQFLIDGGNNWAA